MRIPVVLDFIVGPAWKSFSNERPTIAQKRMKLENEVILVGRDVSSLDIRSEIVNPS